MKFIKYTEFSLLLESTNTIKINLPKAINQIHKAFKKNKYKLYVVGGAVRDAILGMIPKDFDLTTDAKPDEVQRILNDAGISNFPKGEAFGVISAVIDKEEYEIATFREDVGKGRRPDAVNFTTIDKDVLRRDLTINALFYDIDREEVVDLVGGVKDLMDKFIRTVGDPLARFGEDPLRKMRALRFASRLGGTLDPKIVSALSKDEWKDYSPDESLGSVSKERIKAEFKGSIDKAKSAPQYLQWLQDYNYWPFIFPSPKGFSSTDTSYINKKWINTNNWIVQLATLLKNVNLSENRYNETLKKQYAYTIEEIRAIESLHKLMSFETIQISDIKKNLSISNVSLRDALEFAEFNAIDTKLIRAIYKFETSVKGDDERLSGLSGKQLGDKMKEMEAEAFKKIYNG